MPRLIKLESPDKDWIATRAKLKALMFFTCARGPNDPLSFWIISTLIIVKSECTLRYEIMFVLKWSSFCDKKSKGLNFCFRPYENVGNKVCASSLC